MTPRISSVRFSHARPAERRQGLIGWVSFILDGTLLIDGLALRRSRSDQLVFSWPGRKGRTGEIRHHVRPLDDRSRDALEGQLLAHLFPMLQDGAA